MKPLQSVAMGLVIIVLSARVHGYDALPDPVGWVLVLVGVAALPTDLAHRTQLLGFAGLAGAVAVAVWFPGVTDRLYSGDTANAASLAWVANLPQVVFSALLCHDLAGRAAAAGDGSAARWLALTRSALVLVGLMPVLVFGAGLTTFEVTSYVAAAAVAVVLIWQLFTYASRGWTGVPSRP